MVKLQVALDVVTTEEAINIARKVADYVDIIELGTPLLKEESTEKVVRIMKANFPQKTILADFKTMDVGKLEAELAFRAGADIMTVCATASDTTIKAAIETARKTKKEVLIDLIGVRNKFERVAELLKFKPHYICVHTGIDEKAALPLSDTKKISELLASKKTSTKLVIAGGISMKNIKRVLSSKPDVVVVGRAITKAKNPRQEARKMLSILKGKRIKKIILEQPKSLKELIKPAGTILLLKQVEKELQEVLEKINPIATQCFIEYLLKTERIFVAGQGRSGLIGMAFAMRLMQLGLNASVVGETTTPAIEKLDLLVAVSGTGSTKLTLDIINSARKKYSTIALITANKNSEAAKKANLVIQLPTKINGKIEPLGSLFEQAALLYLDCIIIALMKRLGQTSKEMRKKHA